MDHPTLNQPSCQEASSSAEPTTDCLSSLPPSVLATIHGHVYGDSVWGLRHALSLEAASKHLNTLLRTYTRFPKVEVTDRNLPASAAGFWKWVATNVHRVDHLAFETMGGLGEDNQQPNRASLAMQSGRNHQLTVGGCSSCEPHRPLLQLLYCPCWAL
jgi:hypothetical protein